MKTLKSIFLSLMTVYIIVREVIPLNFLIDNIIVTSFFFFVSAVFIVIDFITQRSCLKTSFVSICLVFLAITLLSVLINYKYGIFENVKAVGIYIIYIFLIYPTPKRHFAYILNTFVATLSLFTVISVLMYILNIDYVYITKNSFYLNQGFSNTFMRLWGVFSDPNAAAVYCLVAITMSVYLIKTAKHLFKKIVLIGLSCVNFIFVILSGSRTAAVMLILTTLWLAILLSLKLTSYKALKKACLCVFSSVLCFLGVAVLFVSVKATLPYVKYATNQILSRQVSTTFHKLYDSFYKLGNVNIVLGFYSNTAEQPSNDLAALDRTDTEKEDFTNGRWLRWRAGFEIIKKAPIIGCSPRNHVAFAKANLKNSLIAKGYSIHNCYIEVIAYTGFIGAAIIFLFLILTALNIIKACFKTRLTLNKAIFSTTALITAAAAFFFADMLFFHLTAGGMIFWLSAGSFKNGGELFEASDLRT